MSYNTYAVGGTGLQRIVLAFRNYMTRPTANSTAAIVIWLMGALATRTFLIELGVGTEDSTLLSGVMSITLQAVLTLLEGPVWHSVLRSHKTRFVLGVGALVVDIILNIGGCWFFLQNLGNTTFWQAIAAATNTQTGPSPLTILLLSALIALAISAGPEALWDL